MKQTMWLLVLIVLFAVYMSGCAKQMPKPKEVTAAPKTEVVKEAAKPEAGETDADADTLAEPVSRAQADTSLAGTRTVSAISSATGQPSGYCVQLFASSTPEGGLKFVNEAKNRFADPVYVVFEDGLYKVRVASCLSRDQADAIKAKARDMGYADSWVVAPGTDFKR